MTRWIRDYQEQNFLFGLCLAVSRRAECSVWIVRLIAVLALLMWPLKATLVYLALALILPATRAEAIQGLGQFANWCREVGEKLVRLTRLKCTEIREARRWRGDEFKP